MKAWKEESIVVKGLESLSDGGEVNSGQFQADRVPMSPRAWPTLPGTISSSGPVWHLVDSQTQRQNGRMAKGVGSRVPRFKFNPSH